jgi:nitroimidazol reductase NimA-like FMN-containing flavoprotein (pyridoxamine 5'-phosphate oxidase superfamily)
MESLAEHEEYLDITRIPLRLACTTSSGWPVVLSLWFVYTDGALFCATREDARVISYLDRNASCAFEIASDQPPYCGIRGQAKATLTRKRGVEILEKLIERYLGGSDNPLAEFLLKDKDQEIAIRLDPVTLHTWDFSSRMKEISTEMQQLQEQICP